MPDTLEEDIVEATKTLRVLYHLDSLNKLAVFRRHEGN